MRNITHRFIGGSFINPHCLLGKMEDNPSGYHVIGDEEHYKHSRFIQELGGDSPKNRVLEYLMLQEDTPVYYTHVCNATSLGKRDVETVMGELNRQGVLVNNGGDLYSLNLKNPFVQAMIELYARKAIENLHAAKKAY